MAAPQAITFEILAYEAYQKARDVHGDLQIRFEEYLGRLTAIGNKLISRRSTTVASDPLRGLHTTDLYLACACALKSEPAWERFTALYRRYIFDHARLMSGRADAAEEIASQVLVSIFLSDLSGKPRIASYDGLSSLATWLHVVVAHRTSNERRRKSNGFQHVECLSARTGEFGSHSVESVARTNEYRPMILEALTTASRSLSGRERAILLLRYEDGLQAAQVARTFAVSPSAMTRQIQAIHRKTRDRITSVLRTQFRLNDTAVKDCLEEMAENQEYSILEFIRRGGE